MKHPAPEFNLHLTLHAEDQYNFNPGAHDIGSGLPDSANGRFVVVGFAHGYHHTAELTRIFSWKGFDLGVAGMGIHVTMRQHQPQNKGFFYFKSQFFDILRLSFSENEKSPRLCSILDGYFLVRCQNGRGR